MKKLIVSLFALLLTLLAAMLLISCSEEPAVTDPCANGHTALTDAAVPASCTERGLTEGSHCAVCEKVLTAQTVTDKLAHTPGEWVETLAPTCSQKGSSYRACTVCHAVLETKTVDTVVHSITDWTVLTPASCTQVGFRQATCSLCGEQQSESIEKLAHTPATWQTAIAPTCTTKGQERLSCKVCKGTIEIRTLEALDHTYGSFEQTTAPTCVTVGSQHRFCDVCDHEDVAEIPATGHKELPAATILAVTCTKDGLNHYTCETCGKLARIEVVPTPGHDYGTWTRLSEPTCTTTGSQKRVCSVQSCGYVDVQPIALLSHTYTEWVTDALSTCSVNGLRHRDCSVCLLTVEIEELPRLAHNYSDWTKVSDATCSTLGQESRSCSVCQSVETKSLPTLPHTPGDWTVVLAATATSAGSQTKECSVCHAIIDIQTIPATGTPIPLLYTTDGGKATVTGYTDLADTALVIPDTLGGCPVTKIAAGAFAQADRFTSITLPTTLVEIEQDAFTGCSLLTRSGTLTMLGDWVITCDPTATTLSIPMSVKGVANGAFYACNALTAISVGNGNTAYRVLNGCLVENASKTVLVATLSATVPTDASVTAIAPYAFVGHKTVRALTIPSNIQTIGEGAFGGWYALNELTLPASVTAIGQNAFERCYTLVHVTNLTGLSLSAALPSNPSMQTRTSTSTAFTYTLATATNGLVTYTVNSTIYLIGYTGTASRLSLSISTTNAVYPYALVDNAFVTQLVIPSALTNIGTGAFAGCKITALTATFAGALHVPATHLRSLTVTGSPTEVPSNFLNGCATLETLSLPASILVKRTGALEGCTNVKTLYAPANMLGALPLANLVTLHINGGTSIPGKAFHNHTSLKTVTIAASVTVIGGQAFHNASALETVTFASSSKLTEIKGNAFCSTPLKSINLPEGLQTIGSQCFMNCTQLASVTLPSTLTTLYEEIFNGCSALTSIVIPKNVTVMGNRSANNIVRGMFAFCTSLKSVTFEQGSQLTNLSTYCFYGCTSLTSVTIPASVTAIGFRAFEGSGVTSVSFENTSGWKIYKLTSFSNQVEQLRFKNLGTGTAQTVTSAGANATAFKSENQNSCYFWVRG